MGLLALLGEASKFRDERKASWVRDRLALTPLERIAAVYEANEDGSFFRVAGAYKSFLAQISDPGLRTNLNNLDYDRRYESMTFAALKANSDVLQSKLTHFILARRGQ